MNSKLSIALCENYYRELTTVLSNENISDVDTLVFPSNCKNCFCNMPKKPDTNTNKIIFLISSNKNTIENKFSLCQTQLISSSLLYQMIQEGGYILTPGWLLNWKKYLFIDWGFNRESGKTFLQESARKLILLDTGIYENILTTLKEFSEFSGLPYEVINVGMEYFRNNFLNIYNSWKISFLENDIKKKSVQISNLSLIYELLPQISLVATIAQVIEQEFNILVLLTAASKLAFLPTDNILGSELIFMKNKSYDTELLNLDVANFKNDMRPTNTGVGFIIKISLDSTVLGFMEIEDILFKEHLQDYMDVASFIGKIFALALLNASHFELLTQTKNKAESANNAKGIFLANMSHELRTPLNVILGYCQVILRNNTLQNTALNQIKIIEKSGEHLLALINEVLEMSKMEAGHGKYQPNNFNIHSSLKTVEGMFREKCDSKNLHFEITGIDSIPQYIYTDEIKFKMVLINLIGNSVKFTEKGYIVVRLSTEEISLEEFTLHVEVEDTGYGISEEDSKKLFTSFSQTESGQKSNTGTGLGLAISKEYLKLMGGDISFEKNYKAGSLFKFYIKAKVGFDNCTKSPQKQGYVKGLITTNYIPKLLIADDNFDNRILLATLLKETGFIVKEVENGVQAIEECEKWHPDFIWMDTKMPIINGIEAAKKIRETPFGKNVKIVSISANSFIPDKDKLNGFEFDDYVEKPYQENIIFELLKKHLGVNYIYENTLTKNLEPKETGELDLSFINNEMLTDLLNAANTNDMNKISQISQELKKTDPEMASRLQNLADNFDYEPIKTAILKLKKGREA